MTGPSRTPVGAALPIIHRRSNFRLEGLGTGRLAHPTRHPTEEEEDLLLPQAKKEKRNVKSQKVFSFVFILFLIWLRVSPGYVGSGWGRLHPASIPPVSLLLNSGQRLEGKCVRMPLTITESL